MNRAVTAVLAALITFASLSTVPAAAAAVGDAPPAGTSADGAAPIIVLLDVSGSMNDDDSGGLTKLEGAKNGVRDIVGALSASTTFGVWRYPNSGCDGGDYVSAPAPLSDRAAVLSKVAAMGADGDTPTGVALRSLADDLTAKGYRAATIVLVSDGESTCGPPPCDVAKELTDEGFSVTVPTIGFRTSAKGAEELSCIAEATGAATYSAGDSAELAEQLNGLVRAQLELKVRYDAAPMAGSSTRITAEIKHTGGEEAREVRVALSFADGGDPSQQRAAIPPVIRVGNIPAGTTVERTWTVGTGPRDSSVTNQFVMSAWGANAPRVMHSGDYRTEEPRYTKRELGPIFAQVSNERPLVVFGDSYSSGEGIGLNYEAVPDGVSTKCHRSPETYLGSVFSDLEMTIVACSGAVSDALTGTSGRSNMSQVQEMNSRAAVPGAGVMTFGGNDIGFEEILVFCVNPQFETVQDGCGYSLYAEAKLNEARSMDYSLSQTYRTAWSALNSPQLRGRRDGAYVPLVVLPYPKIVHEPRYGGCGAFNPREVAFADSLVTTLNDAIETAVKTVRSEGYEVYYVADVEDSVRPANTVCASGLLAHINALIPSAVDGWPPVAPESFHPKKQGYVSETDAIIRWVGAAEQMTAKVSDDAITRNLGDVADPIEIRWPTPVEIKTPSDDMLLIRGGAITPSGSNYAPGSPVTVSLHSDPVVLGTLTADKHGYVSGQLSVPGYVTTGQHELVVTGIDEDGEFIEDRIPVSIIEPTPLWVWVAVIGAALGLIGGGVLMAMGLLRRNRAKTSPH